MDPTIRQLWSTAAVAVVSATMVLSGFAVGRFTVIREFDRQIEGASRASTLGEILDGVQREGVVRAYHERERVLDVIDDISWSVPTVPTPFVGNAPAPGRHGVAYVNSMQLRADDEIGDSKDDDTYRVFLTGGSTAYGSGAPSQDRTVAGYLSDLLSIELSPSTGMRYEVWTAANPGWATTHERIFIENRLSELDPDMVVSLSGNNDVHWGKLGRNVLWFRSYEDDLFLRLINTAYELSGRQRMLEVIELEPDEIPPLLVANRLAKNVKLSAHVLSEKQAEYVFVLQPTMAVTGKGLTERERSRLRDQAYFQSCYAQIDGVLRGFQAENYQYVNLAGVFDGLSDADDVFIDSYHFGDKGNEMIAGSIFGHVRERIARRRLGGQGR